MKTIYFLLTLLALTATALAQNISRMEYWIDNDPGFGLADNIPGIPSQQDIIAFNFNIPAQAPGFHTVGLRSKDALGKWSHTNFFTMYTYDAPTNANITKIRYWIDTEPGFTAGTAVTGFTASPNVANHSFTVPPLSNGFHTIGVRSQDANGKWSHTNFHSVFVSDNTVYNLNQLEYYWGNTDPGFNNAADTIFSVAVTDINNGSFILQNPPTTGTYTLFLRTRDVNARWSHTNYVQGIVITDCSAFVISLSNGALNICQGQSATVSANNGNSYSWTPAGGLSSSSGSTVTVSPTVSTTYSVTGVSNGCSNTQTVAVTVNQNPVVTASAANAAICNGASTSLTASGASSYIWSSSLGTSATVSVTPGSSATYTVTGTNAANCTASATVSVTVNPNPIVTISAADDSVCQGASVSLTASGAASYLWNNGLGTGATVSATPAVNTTYAVTGTDANSCTGSATQIVTVLPVPATPTVQVDGIVNLSSSVSGTSYQWYLNGNPISGATNQNYTATENGLYAVVIFNQFGCESASSAEVNVVIDGIVLIEAEQNILVYPNPNQGEFWLSGTALQTGDLILVSDVLGRNMLQTVYPLSGSIKLNEASSGMYLLTVIRNGVSVYTTKIIKD